MGFPAAGHSTPREHRRSGLFEYATAQRPRGVIVPGRLWRVDPGARGWMISPVLKRSSNCAWTFARNSRAVPASYSASLLRLRRGERIRRPLQLGELLDGIEDVFVPKRDGTARRRDLVEDVQGQARVSAARLPLCGGIPRLRAHTLEFEFIPRLLGELIQELLGHAAVPLAHGVPEIELSIMVSEPLDERRFLQSFQVIFGGEITENFLSPGFEGMNGSLQRCKGRTAFRKLDRAVLTGPVKDILKQVPMDGAVVRGIEVSLQGTGAQLLGALTRGFVFEGAQCRGVGQTRFIFEDVRVQAKNRRPTRPSTGLKRVRGGVDAR